MHNLSPQEVYENLVAQGEYEEVAFEQEVVGSTFSMLVKDYAYVKTLKSEKNPRWRVIFNAYYDVLRELCDILLTFKKQKSGNHRGVFALVVIHFPSLELDWELLERMRNLRNASKYQGSDISTAMWKSVEMALELYISALQKEVEKRLNEK